MKVRKTERERKGVEEGEDVKNQQQLFVAKMIEDNFKKKKQKRNQQQLL